MEESSDKVTVHGFWASPYVYRVIWALKLKGVEYDYIEEDLTNKTSSLLEYNPVHKKVPVLVHGGNPLAESAIIIEYIEETWSNRTPLLPEDPYQRARAHFWIDFAQQKSVTFSKFFLTSEEDKEKTATQVLETLKIIEKEALGDKKFFGGDTINLVDLFYGWLAHWLQPMEQLAGVQVLEPTNLPKLHQWIINFKQQPVIKDNLPDSAKLLAHFDRLRKIKGSPNNKP